MAGARFNPLDKLNLGESVAKALLEAPVRPLSSLKEFQGAGIYAIYYTGNNPLYAPLARANREQGHVQPIYVGKAVPPGARKGGFGLNVDPGKVLYKRLCEHAESISQAASSLKPEDFHCRYLVTDDIWIPLGESLLIERFKPIWNKLIDGFGNHDPGKGRRKQQKSAWDTLHPGRPWANKLQPPSKSENQLRKLVQDFMKGEPVPLIPTEKAVLEEES